MTVPTISQQTLKTFALTLWSILFGGIRIFAWDSLREGFIDIRPLPRVARLLAIVGMVFVFLFIGSIFFNNVLRWSGSLQLLPLASSGSRGFFVPSTAVPLAYLATILAWTFLLTGALHIHVAVRWAVFAAFLFFGLPAIFGGMIQGASSDRPLLLAVSVIVVVSALALLLASFLILPRVRLPLAVEFVIVLALVGGLFIINLFASVESTRLSTIDFVSGYLVSDAVTGPRTLIVPMLYLSGAEMINFGISLTGWGAQSAQRYAKAWTLVVLLFVLLAFRWFEFVTRSVLPGVSVEQLQHWGGALLAGIVLLPVAYWRAKQNLTDRVPLKLIVGLILGMILPQLVLLILITLTSAYFSVAVSDPNVLANMERVNAPLIALSNGLRDFLYLELAVAGAVIAFIAARRKRYTVAAFGMLLGWTQFVWWFMENGRPLQEWRYHYSDVEPWLVLALTALTVWWLARRELNSARALALLGLAFFAWILNFTDFLDNPLALFFGFAGIFFTAFGILWGVLTAGGKFANFDSLRFPRLSRIVLYLGYILLTLNLTHWFTVTHNVPEQVFNGDITLAGLRIFGYTAAYLVFVEGGRALLKKEN